MTTPIPVDGLPNKYGVGRCPHSDCNLTVQFDHQGSPQQVWPRFSPVDPFEGHGEGVYLQVWRCPACTRTAVVLEEVKKDARRNLLAWPQRSPRELAAEVPATIRGLFTEGAVAEYAGALRAAAAMYRAALEEICRERGAGNGSLEKKIDALKSKGVPDDVVDQFHEARFLGNWSLHDAVEFAPDEVADVAELIRDAVFEIYVQPAQRQALRGARQARRDAHRAAQNKTPNQDL